MRADSTRRSFLRLAASGAVSFALPGVNAREPGEFVFAVANDLHYRDARCGAWLGRVAADLRARQPAFLVLAGDLSEDGAPGQLAAVRKIFAQLPLPVHAVIGNHDHTPEGDRSAYEAIYGSAVNYRFNHGGCQFLVLDSTQGREVYRTRIPLSTFAWVNATLPTLSRDRPLVLLTHFPLGRNWLRPRNAGPLLALFKEQRLVSTFSGHWHGLTEHKEGETHLSTARCCSWWRDNHDGSKEKGYTLCRVISRRSGSQIDWTIAHEFIAVS